MRQRRIIIGTFTALAALALGLSACASDGGEAASSPPPANTTSPTATAASPTSTPTPTPAPTAPTLADLDGTWCVATDAATCMTITNGMTDGGATVEVRDDDADGAPCLVANVSDGDGGFVVFYCPAGVTPATPVVTEEGTTLDLDNQDYERLFATQAPPNVQTWYRQSDLTAATQG